MVEGTRVKVYAALENFFRREEIAIKQEAEQLASETVGYESDLKELVASIDEVVSVFHRLNEVLARLEQKRVAGPWGTTRCTIPLRMVEV